ncbi:MAG: nucleotidyltransferase domain-containing protein [Thermoplasmata archaeon]
MCRICRDSDFDIREDSEHIRRLVHDIIDKMKPKRIILFGSRARNDYRRHSDIDLLIVGDYQERFFDRIARVLALNTTPYDLEPLVYTEEEFDRLRNRLLLRHILRNGIEVYPA